MNFFFSYGKSLRHYCSVIDCETIIYKNNEKSQNAFSILFQRCGDCNSYFVRRNLDSSEQFVCMSSFLNQLQTEEYEFNLRTSIDQECQCKNCKSEGN